MFELASSLKNLLLMKVILLEEGVLLLSFETTDIEADAIS